jgi:hypothetical protein
MLLFQSDDTLQAAASVDTSIVVLVYGLRDVAGVRTYEKLYQGQPAAAGSTLFSVTTTHTYLVKSIMLANPTGTARTIKLWHDGSADINTLLPVVTIGAGEWAVYNDGRWVFYDNGGAEKLTLATAASGISILDAANDFTATNVEDALQELQADNEAHVAAADPHTGYVLESLIDAVGDLYVGSADNAVARLAKGTDGQVLETLASETLDLRWASRAFTLGAFVDGAGAVVIAGVRPLWYATFACTVTGVRAYADTGTTTVVNAGTGASSAEDFCSSNITINPSDAWEVGTVNQNQAVAIGETVSVEIVTAGTATQVTIQIELTRP